VTTFTITALILAAALYGYVAGYLFGHERGYVRGFSAAALRVLGGLEDGFGHLRLWNAEDLAEPLRGTAGRRVN
jgi:hypothetical protein